MQALDEASRNGAVTIELEHSSTFDEEELAEVRAALEEFGAARIRHLHVPMAGPEILNMLIALVGRSAVEALIGEGAIRLVQELVQRLRCTGRGRPNPLASRISQVTVSFDDLDVGVAFPRDLPLEHLPDILAAVRDRTVVSPPSPEPVHYVLLPAVREDGDRWRWWHPELGHEPYPFRYWLLGVRDASGLTRVYDTRDDRVFYVYQTEAPWRHSNRHYLVWRSDPLESAIARLRPHLSPSEVHAWAQRVGHLVLALAGEREARLPLSDETVEQLLSLCERADRGAPLGWGGLRTKPSA